MQLPKCQFDILEIILAILLFSTKMRYRCRKAFNVSAEVALTQIDVEAKQNPERRFCNSLNRHR